MRDSTREDYEARIWRVQRYVQGHLDEPLSLDRLAEVAAFSPFHFHRIFRAMVGESLQEYVSRLRIELAAAAIVNTKKTIVEIALDAGYEAHESFSRAFRRRFGVSPKSYRESRGALGASIERLERGPKLSTTNTERTETVNVEIRTLPPRRVAFVRHVGPYTECAAAWGKLCASPRIARFFGPNMQMLGACYDDPDVTAADKIRYDACIVVDEGFEAGDGIDIQEIAGGDYAVCLHEGPYENLHGTYRGLYGQWLPESGREARSNPSIEIYLNDPKSTPPADLRTEIQLPLA